LGEKDVSVQKPPPTYSNGGQGSVSKGRQAFEEHGHDYLPGAQLIPGHSSLPPNFWPHSFLPLSLVLTVLFIPNLFALPFAIVGLILSIMVSDE
jgi:hypothetical protein